MRVRTIIWIILFISLLTQCRGKEKARERKIELTVWAMGAEGEKIELMTRKFEKENPNISVVTQSIPWSDAHAKLVTSAIGGTTPDLCQLGTTWVPEFAAMGVLTPLDDYVKSSPVVNKENFFESSWNTNLINGKLYGIPWYVDTRVLFYRKDILSQVDYDHPPRTWAELKDVCHRLAKDLDGDGTPDRYGINIGTNDSFLLIMFIWQNNGTILNPDNTTPTFNNPRTKEAFDFFISFFRENLAPISEATDIDLFNAFKTGFLPMFISGPWMLERIHEQIPEIKGKWTVAVLPKKENNISFVGGCNFVIFRNSKKKDAAWKFIEYITKPQNQVEWFKLTRDLPAVKSAWNDKILMNKPMIEVFGEQLKSTKNTPAIPQWEEIRDRIEIHLQEAVYKRKTTAETIKAIQDDVRKILIR